MRDPDKLGCVTQTTLSVDDTREVIEALARRFPNIRLPRKDDICYATQNRQNAVKKLIERAQLVLVVGSPASSNANRLVELTRKAGVAAHMVQNGDAIDPAWLAGVECVGVTASASTPGAARRAGGRAPARARRRRGRAALAARGRRGRRVPDPARAPLGGTLIAGAPHQRGSNTRLWADRFDLR